MTIIVFTFTVAFLFSLAVTPLVSKAAFYLDLVDKPSERKIHEHLVPRVGGIAIFLAFFFPFLLVPLFTGSSPGAAEHIFVDEHLTGFVLGAALIFFTGLIDDIWQLPASVKFCGQLLAALVSFYWGFQISMVSVPFFGGVSLGILSLPVTIFWFVLLINAINLADGLDGLAAGICLFVSLAMLFVCVTSDRMVEALAFASMTGTLLGFLRYNFNPASIFMGDCGSYFLGYCLAAFSVVGSIKGQFATAMLIPIIALGVPLIDTLWAPLRRFVFGQKIFQPDREHFHHKLVMMGYTQRRAVLLIYGITVVLGIGAITLVHAQDDLAALILFILGIGVIALARYLSFSDYITMRRVVGWAQDLSDEVGISHQRRSFLNHQARISKATDYQALWLEICASLRFLRFDYAQACFGDNCTCLHTDQDTSSVCWQRSECFSLVDVPTYCLLKIDIPLYHVERDSVRHLGYLTLAKDMSSGEPSQYILKRVEHLRRTIVATLQTLPDTSENIQP